MKRLAIGILCLLATAARAQTPTPATFNPIPQNNGSFFTTLYNFLLNEDADRFDTGFHDYRVAGCTHPTAAGLTGSFSTACTAFIDGHYIVDPAPSVTYVASSSDVCWLALNLDTTSSVAGWTRQAGTHYIYKCNNTASPRPTLPAHTMITEKITVTGSAIAAVAAEFNSLPYVRTYTATSEIDTTDIGSLWQDNTTGTICYVAQSVCNGIPSGDTSGCATCGDTATAFFAAGAIEPARGGTGDDTSAVTGVPVINSGNWTYPPVLDPGDGGLGGDFSACVGVPDFLVAATSNCDNFPTWKREKGPGELSVDGTQCQKTSNDAFVSGVVGDSIKCADNNNGRIWAHDQLPPEYETATNITVRLAGANTGTTSGDTQFDVACLCANGASGAGTILSASNFGSTAPMTFTWSGSAGQFQFKSVTLTCGGSCTQNYYLWVRFAANASGTTITTATDVRYSLVSLLATTDNL